MVSSNMPSSSKPSTPIQPSFPKPPKPRPSVSSPHPSLVPRSNETLYEWVTRECFKMGKEMKINEHLTIEHTLKMIPNPKIFSERARLATRECDFCCKINETRPEGAKKIPCIVSTYGDLCVLCHHVKKEKQDCQAEKSTIGLPSRHKYEYFLKETFESPRIPSTPRRVRGRTLKNANEEDMAARKRTKVSLDRESNESRGRSESASHSSTHLKDTAATKVSQSVEKRDGMFKNLVGEQKTQGMVNREGKEASPKPFMEGKSPKKCLETPSENQSSLNLEHAADFMLLETISTPLNSIKHDSAQEKNLADPQKSGRKSMNSTERTISPNTSIGEGVDASLLADRSGSTSATKESTPPEDADPEAMRSEVLKPLTSYLIRQDQIISDLKAQITGFEARLNEEKLKNQNYREVVNEAEKIKQKGEEEQKSIKAERERTRLEVGYLKNERDNLVTGNEKLMGRNRELEAENEELKGSNEELTRKKEWLDRFVGQFNREIQEGKALNMISQE